MNCKLTDASTIPGRQENFLQEFKAYQLVQSRQSARNTPFIRPILWFTDRTTWAGRLVYFGIMIVAVIFYFG